MWLAPAGDWGDLNAADRAANDRALQSGERIISAYRLGNDQKIWIITEADRSATTIVLPAEYEETLGAGLVPSTHPAPTKFHRMSGAYGAHLARSRA